MVTYIIGFFLTTLVFVLPEWQLWPEKVFDGFEYFINTLMSLNNILIVVPDIFQATVFFLRFLFWFGTFLIVRKIFNYIRGTGQGI